MGSIPHSSRREDDELAAILAEAGIWTIYGRAGRVLGSVASLAHALHLATCYAASGVVVVSVCQQPDHEIIVVRPQMDRLRKRQDYLALSQPANPGK